jgi:hypothetical protein
MRQLIITSSLTHSLLLVLPVILALVLRALRCPGHAVLGGILAGAILGPTVLGRMAPESYERFFVEGSREHLPADESTSEPAVLAADRWHFQRPFRSYTAAVTTLTLLGAGLLRRRTEGSTKFAAALGVGVSTVLLPTLLTAAAAWGLWHLGAPQVALCAACVVIGPWRNTDDATITTAGRIASVLAITAVVWALATRLGGEGLIWAAPLLALPAGWLLPALDSQSDGLRTSLADLHPIAMARLVHHGALLPSLAACAAMRVPLDDPRAWWPLVILAPLSLIGRGLGASLASALLRRPRPPAIQAALACGPTQLAILALAVHTWSLPTHIAPGLLAGAALLAMASDLAPNEERRD